MNFYYKLIHTNNGDYMNNNSIWTINLKEEKINKLTKDITVDILIIGGGMTGLSTAYQLINKGLNIAVVERNRIGMGITSRSTAKITYLQENIYSKLKKYHNEEVSKKYLDSQLEAIDTIKRIIQDNKIDCDFYKVDSYLFTEDKEKIKDVKEEKELLEKFGIKTKEFNKLPDNKKVKYSFSVSNTYVFHPIKYLRSLKNILNKNNIKVYEDSKITKIDKRDDLFICSTDKSVIKTKKVVIATHYPYFLFPFIMPLKCSLEKSYIGVEEVDKFLDFSAINTSIPTKSIRYHKDNKNYRINLINSHNLAFKNNDKENFKKLLKNNYKCIWSNHDIMTNDNIPFIGKIDNDLLIGTGYNTWGMTNSSIASKVLSDIILNKENKYKELFNPKRGLNISKIIRFPIILSSNIKSFIGSKINKNKSWYSKNVIFKKINGKNVGIYIDEKNIKHIIYNKCPHLGCSLEFNEIEHTWDCPCHGSRFDIDGKVITGPSNYDITYKEE